MSFEPLPLIAETLTSLLNEGTERAGLDYKRRVDLNDTKDKVAVIKDLGAMQVEGGYIVIGADDNGRPSGQVAESEAKLFDQATLHSKIERYLAEGFDIRCTALKVDDQYYGLICVMPHPDGFAPFREDGAYAGKDNSPCTAFRKGEVFARHGSKSERWDQSDVRKVIQTIRHQEREGAREEFRIDLQAVVRESGAAMAATAPIAALTFNLDTETLVNTVLEQLRRHDEIPLTLLLRRAGPEARKPVNAADSDGLDVILDRLVSLAGGLLTIGRPDLVQRTISALAAIYDLGFDRRGFDKGMMPIASFDIGLRVITRVQALGALAVREAQWPTIRELVLQRPKDRDGDYWQNWIRRGLVMAARGGLLQDPENQPAGISPLLLAQQHISRLSYLRQDLTGDDEDIITSLCQFDLLYCLVAYGTHPQRRFGEFLPSFARWDAQRSDPAAVVAIEDRTAREAIFPHNDQELADALRMLAEQAQAISFPFGGWASYEDSRIVAFLEHHPAKQ